MHTIESAEPTIVNKNTVLLNSSTIRAVQYKGTIISGFPRIKGTRYTQLETKIVTEWKHSNRLEAIITAVQPSMGNRLDFFATDYALNSATYKEQKDISANLIGLAYLLESFDGSKFDARHSFSEEFCGYFPFEAPDEISVIGIVQDVREYNFGDIAGYITTLCIALNSEDQPGMILDVFVAKSNLHTELVIGKQVAGPVWLVGTLEQ